MTSNRYYSGLDEIKEVTSVDEANDLLKTGYELMAVKERSNDAQTVIVYVMGRW